MENQINCAVCEQQYTDQNPPRLLVTCGHTFCEGCISNMIVQKKGSFKIVCPQDGEMSSTKDKSLSSFPKNIALLKVIQNKQNNLSFKDSSLEMSKIPNQEYTPEDDDTKDLMDAINGKTQNSGQKKQKQQPTIQMCLLHHKPLEVVCIIDLKKICASCAIFGEHKGHEFKSLEEIQNERFDYYNSILKIMEKKDTIAESISNQQTCSSIMGLLDNKREKMKKQIGDRYKKLIDTIEKKQKESFKNLQNIVTKTESKLKNLMKIDSQILSKYDTWEQKSYSQIKVLQGDDFEAKLQLLFTDYDAGDILDDGDKILQEMEKQEQNLIQEVELALQNIGVDYNSEVHNHLDNFIDIYEEKKKRNKSRVSKEKGQNNESPNKGKKEETIPKPIKQKKTFTPQQKVKVIEHQPESLIATNQESLLQMDQQVSERNKSPLKKMSEQLLSQPEQKLQRISESIQPPVIKIQKPQQQIIITPPQQKPIEQKKRSPNQSEKLKLETSFSEKTERILSKKKIAKIKVPEKYEKVLDGVVHDTLETVDFTNAELGDASVTMISELLRGTKAKTVKFIRNKLEDETIHKMLPYLNNVITLNLSQNFLTEKTLEILVDGRDHMPNMKNIILSQNKIIERKHKVKIQKLRKLDLTVSV